MKISLQYIKVKDIFNGYIDKDDDGVYGYGGKLDIRPAYQRNFVYNESQSREVIYTILKNFPLNIMYWVKTADNKFEVLDGQQRTLAIMQFLDHKYDIVLNGKSYYCDSLPDDLYERLINYELFIYICEGETSEKLEWFNIVNLTGVKLTDQELRNSAYTGKWLSDAKYHFSKRNCAAYSLGKNYFNGDPNRQELLEIALKGLSGSKDESIVKYMSDHSHNDDADELWQYYQDVIHLIEKIFTNYRKEMKGLDWCSYYNKYKDNTYNSTQIEKSISNLMQDDDVTSKKGIYLYILTGQEKYLNIREFPERDKRSAYERQKGKCAICKKTFDYSEMHGDHIKAWSKGGKTEPSNCQMLCTKCNLQKSSDDSGF